MKRLLLVNISELVTLGPLARSFAKQLNTEDLGILRDAWLCIEDGKVSAYGTGRVPETLGQADTVIDAKGMLVMPGLVDAHTHPIFFGDRSDEFAQRLNGKTYTEIADLGGGILASISKTEQASDADLLHVLEQRLQSFLAFGVTTAECKSGYAQNAREEIRHLRLLSEYAGRSQMTLLRTCLALHATPKGRKTEDYVDEMTREVLPLLAREKLADFVDAFIEAGYFSVAQVERYMRTAKNLGLGIRIHADEFSDAGAAEAAAAWGALSADHLQHASDAGIAAMAAKGVVATLLPGTSLYTKIPFAAAQRFIKAGCRVAIASDYNPGSCYLPNLPMLVSVGAVHCGLNVAQAFAAVTLVAAWSLGLKTKGALAEGYDADFMIHSAGNLAAWFADMGQTKPLQVWIKGKRAL